MFESTGIGSLRRNAAYGVLAFVAAALSTATVAQQASPSATSGSSAAPDGNTALAEVIVTGSRIRGVDFATPTPVSTVTSEALEQRASTNIADFLNELPSFRPTATPTSSGLSVFLSGANLLDLRGLGTERTLVLFNGRRQVPTVLQGVDLNTVPSTAIARIDVVTGGASAAYGSDAVAGVVNVIYDTQFEGLKLEAQTGISAQGDAGDDRLAFAFGSTLADARGHGRIAGEWQRRSKGIDQRDRDWANDGWGPIPNPANTGPNDGVPSILTRPDRRLSIATDGGLILGPGPLAFREFAPDGTLRAFQRGSSAGSTWMQGGSGSDFTPDVTLFTPYERRNLLATFEYAVTDDVRFFLEGGYSQSESTNDSVVQPFSLGNLTIRRDNAFLHPSVTTIMDANGIAAFTFSRVHTDFGFVGAENVYRTNRFVGGFTGELVDDRLNWTLTYQRGESQWSSKSPRNLLTANFAKAIDSVINPATGRPACRSALAGTDPGCVPINLFGVGAPTAAALKYIQGTSVLDQTITQELVSAEVNGSLFDNWAGPVGVALGIEHRKDRLVAVSDDLSNASAYLFVNAKSLAGEVSVKEAFAETVFPLLSPDSLLGAIELNGAVRYTDY
ncbi:MAG: TonB-dependent receptor plug domain-containing protein, partial [Actinomycetota bacterium]